MASCKSSNAKCQKSVTFTLSTDQIHEIENLQDFTTQEKSQIWFNRDEFRAIKASYLAILKMMRTKELLQDTEEHCTRGLECWSVAGGKRRRDTQRNGLVAVLGEQTRQRGVDHESVNNEETLAIVYRQFTQISQQAATNMGRRDHQGITDYAYDLAPKYLVGLQQCQPVRAARRTSPTRIIVGLGGGGRKRVSLGGASRRRAAAA
jgi:hypothetical protein